MVIHDGTGGPDGLWHCFTHIRCHGMSGCLEGLKRGRPSASGVGDSFPRSPAGTDASEENCQRLKLSIPGEKMPMGYEDSMISVETSAQLFDHLQGVIVPPNQKMPV